MRAVIERFDGPARAAVEGAYQAARELEHNQVGTEHLLLGILAEADTGAAGALMACGATLEGCRAKAAEAVASKRPGTVGPDLTFTDRANLALERAGRLSLRQRCEHVEVRHILLSVLDVEGTAGQVLRGLTVDPDCVRQRLSPPPVQHSRGDVPQSPAERPAERAAEPPAEGLAPPPAPRLAEPGAPVKPRCPQCGSHLESTLAHRVLDSQDDEGATALFLVAYCSRCGCAIAGGPA